MEYLENILENPEWKGFGYECTSSQSGSSPVSFLFSMSSSPQLKSLHCQKQQVTYSRMNGEGEAKSENEFIVHFKSAALLKLEISISLRKQDQSFHFRT